MNLFDTQKLYLRLNAVIIFGLVFICSGIAATAQPGAPDTSFGNSGKVQTDVSVNHAGVNDLFVYPDGAVLAVGVSYVNGDNSRTTLARYTSSGALDQSFGSGGIVHLDSNLSGESEEAAFGVAVNISTGKIAVAAEHRTRTVSSPSRDLLVYQLNANGTLDTSFSGDGIATFDVAGGSSNDEAADITYLSSGKILILGNTNVNSADQGFLLRLSPNGTLDQTFGQSGVALINVPGRARSLAAKFAVLTDNNSITVVGAAYESGSFDKDAFAARFTEAGAPDSTFDADGFNVFDFAPNNDEFLNVVLSGNSAIYAVGDTQNNAYALAVRLSTSGALVPAFDADGIATFAGTDADSGLGAAVTPNGKIVFTYGKNDRDFHLLCVNSNGGLDTSFGSNGESVISLTNNVEGFDVANTAAIDLATGRIFVAGESVSDAAGVNLTRFGLVKLQGATTTNAEVSLAGRVVRGKGFGVSNVTITVRNVQTGETRIMRTNALGRYRFDNLPSGQLYVVRAESRLYNFVQSTININLIQNQTDVDFQAIGR